MEEEMTPPKPESLKKYSNGKMVKSEAQLFSHLFKYKKTTEAGCWEWQKFRLPSGYGLACWNRRSYRAHRLMAMLALGFNLKSKMEVCHSCHNPACINPEHLYIANHKKNMEDMVKSGRVARGGDLPQTKLTSEQVVAIKTAIGQGEKFSMLGKKFGVTSDTIASIAKGQSWSYL